MASLLRASVFLALLAAAAAQTHHVVGGDRGWGPDSDLNSWLSGRVFTVGDKILFKYSGSEDSVVELQGLEDFLSCNLSNPIQMYTSHVSLETEGSRYFASADPARCVNGLKLPVHVRPAHDFDPDEHPEFDPPPYDKPSPPHDPPFKPAPPYDPPFKPAPPYDPPFKPTPPYDPPSPPHVRPVPPPPYVPAAGSRLGAWSLVVGLLGVLVVVGI